MTKPLNGHVLSSALDTLVKSPLNQANDAALVSAAEAVWYSDLNLESEVSAFLSRHSDEIEIRRAGYLLERFTRFACVSDSRVLETFNVLELFAYSTFKQDVKPQTAAPLRRRRDELAASWGLSEGLGLKAQTLMPFQTRHYAAEQRTTFS
ncbi:hypothetical protein SAMN04489798_2134 [Pseudomonas arsenicoxydans]|uniref:Uncharacterized protein n=1 Tax=Pseudomonas arsenicoxydans TaxID=702115 RepID=A0A1H0H453_9PSED|nr:hypothetical protein [Pseudomonas arsenicoxydans]SDO14016.1 hypothetical protein SAMN04489798_2134 [Pseudomonas arsenicoxydans]